jgi:hypothetical protein
VNALADARVANYFNETFVSTYLKVGTFQIINGQKVGGNVASYFCLPDGTVVHAIAGPVNADQLLSESRWAYETRKAALTSSTNLATGDLDEEKFREQVKRSHLERMFAAMTPRGGTRESRLRQPFPANLPRNNSQQTQTHWLLAKQPLAHIDEVSPVVWTQILREEESGLPVAKQ